MSENPLLRGLDRFDRDGPGRDDPRTGTAHLSAVDALEQTPQEAAQARYHLRQAIQHLDAYAEGQS